MSNSETDLQKRFAVGLPSRYLPAQEQRKNSDGTARYLAVPSFAGTTGGSGFPRNATRRWLLICRKNSEKQPAIRFSTSPIGHNVPRTTLRFRGSGVNKEKVTDRRPGALGWRLRRCGPYGRRETDRENGDDCADSGGGTGFGRAASGARHAA